MKTKILTSLILLIFLANASFSLYGTRPMSMGGAYTAVANDANAAFWNPAGLALNPGVDLTGSLLLNNRNESIGDNLLAVKLCYETELNPFAWIIGVGAVSLIALEGAKYLSDNGTLKKNWGRSDETTSKDESVSDQVLKEGTEKTVDVGKKIKDTAKETAKDALNAVSGAAASAGKAFTQEFARESARQVYWGPWRYPWYYSNYSRPTYWDDREHYKEESKYGKAQFAGGFSLITDKNSALNQNTNFYIFSLATGYEERVAIGGNINLYDITIPVPNNIKGYGAGIDLGVIAKPTENIALGAVAKEVLTTDVHFQNGATVRYPMSINIGLAIDPIDILTVSGDIHNLFQQNNSPQTYHYGAELRPFPGLAFRGGLYDGNKTAGIGVMVGPVIVDYSYLGGSFNRTQTLGLTWKL